MTEAAARRAARSAARRCRGVERAGLLRRHDVAAWTPPTWWCRMGGYNTVCELLTLRQARACSCRASSPVQEQWIRAERMAELGLLRVLHPDRLDARRR